MGTQPGIRWMALDHKYGSWFDYMELHVKPTDRPPARSYRPSLLFNPDHVCRMHPHTWLRVLSPYLPLFYLPIRNETPSVISEFHRFCARVSSFFVTYMQNNQCGYRMLYIKFDSTIFKYSLINLYFIPQIV